MKGEESRFDLVRIEVDLCIDECPGELFDAVS
jgi:hypothetical protein